MKKFLLIFGVLTLFTNIAFAGSIKIDRVWISNSFGYALVSYLNDTKDTFSSVVTIKCVALDNQGKKININTRSFFVHDYGPIVPGFEGTLKIPVNLYGASMKSMSCSCYER